MEDYEKEIEELRKHCDHTKTKVCGDLQIPAYKVRVCVACGRVLEKVNP